MFRLLVPRILGGLELDILTAVRVFEEIAKVDGSACWAVMIGNGGLFTAWLDLETGMELIGADPHAPMGGVRRAGGRPDVPGLWRHFGLYEQPT
jgi:hypothetical protein